jgi:sodium-dependent dicarboxylate transporter 2/3/5
MSVTRRGTPARAGLWAGVVAFLLVLLLPLPLDPGAQRTAAVAALMSTWWLTEALPLAATALVPLALFPLLGVLTAANAAAPYANPVVFLFLGGFIVAIAMQRWGLHRRIALAIVARAGTQPHMLVLGFMLATAFLSMWISNTATAAMMVPIGIALAELLRPEDRSAPFPFGTALLLGIAYAATIGGIATLIGTPPNAVFAAAARELLGRSISFTEWLTVGLPVALVMLPAAWAVLVFGIFPSAPLPPGAHELLAVERRRLGPRSRAETAVAIVFALMALAWLAREPKQLGAVTLPGITSFAPGVDDATIAIAGALVLFLLPSGEGTAILEWDDLRELPWGVLLLFGGGLSLARAFDASGLTGAFGDAVGALQNLPLWLLLATAVTLFVLLSELASNTAIAAMGMPVLAAAAAGLGRDPVVFMAAGALAASAAFMLPVGTPPNAIAFGSGYITMRDMMRAGLWLNLLAILVITLVAMLLGPVLSRGS